MTRSATDGGRAMAHGEHIELLGRHQECTGLDRLVSAVRTGESRTLLVHGPAGVGKSALFGYLTHHADGMRVLRAAGIESEMELAFATLHQLCAPLLDLVSQLPDPQQAALETVLGLRTGTTPDRFLVGLAVLNLLSAASEECPLLCVVDDAQWMDQASKQILSFVARRLLAESVALVFGSRVREPSLQGLPELEVTGLRDADAHRLLNSVTHAGLDQQIRDRIVAETQGNPLALIELPRGLSVTQIAGGLGLLRSSRRLPGQIERSFLNRIGELPDPTRRLLLIAAAEPVGDPIVVWRAAEKLGISPAAALEAGTDGLLTLADGVTFRHPLVRSAVYGAAEAADRRAVHLALAAVTDRGEAPDRWAWHLAASTAGPDETVAAELERSAGRARARGGMAAAAAFLQRSVGLTSDPGSRAGRAVAAAEVSMQAGDLDAASRFTDVADRDAQSGPQRALAQLLRANLAAATAAPGSSRLLLAAAQQLAPHDLHRARETLVVAWNTAAMTLSDWDTLRAVSGVIRTLPPPSAEPGLLDLVLQGSALLVTDGWAAGVPVVRRAMRMLADAPGTHLLSWGWAANTLISASWDDHEMLAIHRRAVEVVREAGALAGLPFCLGSLGVVVGWTGNFAEATDIMTQADIAGTAVGNQLPPHVRLLLLARQGDQHEAEPLIAATIKQSETDGAAAGALVAQWSAAILHNGLGRFTEALAPALACSRGANLFPAVWVLPELIEAAVHVGDCPTAETALAGLAAATEPAGTDWALGVLARSRALLSDGEAAHELYREAIDRLGRTELRPELARAHLLYGEWLRRERQRVEAREQLRTAYEMFVAIGMKGFAERSRRELMATGETVRKRAVEAGKADELTPQERQIALLVRDGFSNPEIGVRLFLSPRTVEWHLRKVFTKLGVTSRRQIRQALPPDGETATR